MAFTGRTHGFCRATQPNPETETVLTLSWLNDGNPLWLLNYQLKGSWEMAQCDSVRPRSPAAAQVANAKPGDFYSHSVCVGNSVRGTLFADGFAGNRVHVDAAVPEGHRFCKCEHRRYHTASLRMRWHLHHGINEQGHHMKTRFHTPVAPQCSSPSISSLQYGRTPINSEPRPLDGARCVFEVFLTLPHDVPYVRQHLHDSVVNFCPVDCPQSVRIDLEQKPHGTHYRIHVCLSDSGHFSAANHELACTIEKFAGVRQPAVTRL